MWLQAVSLGNAYNFGIFPVFCKTLEVGILNELYTKRVPSIHEDRIPAMISKVHKEVYYKDIIYICKSLLLELGFAEVFPLF